MAELWQRYLLFHPPTQGVLVALVQGERSGIRTEESYAFRDRQTVDRSLLLQRQTDKLLHTATILHWRTEPERRRKTISKASRELK
ncbi:hypothetical protein RvY_18656 [Ramazzottius varieornatus]|uniref:Uncharacterized protein n=1 Tax=Ramazzottius varieornatus TaxID=947166 RepID=A0A1D1W6U1_RAMVA|nr:hypothetical protein RvY_18656 [Ramazzottius varieornatus]